MAEYLDYRCCMCPNGIDSQKTNCPAGHPCRFVKTYVDSRGWKYKVMSGIGDHTYKARYQKPDKKGTTGWKCLRLLEWCDHFDDAQSDLNRYAKKKGWEVIDDKKEVALDVS